MNTSPPVSAELLNRFIDIVGERHALRAAEADLSHYTHDNRGIYVGKTPLVLKPGNTGQVAAIVQLANQENIALVPQGGHTGHAAGGVPSEAGNQIVVTTERLNKIRDIDLSGNTLTVEAGVVLQEIQQIADDNDRLFPLSLAAEGSCQIGGNISTNAGGTAVLAYGNTRQLVLGLEVVLPNGEIWQGLRGLKKDNTGYELKQLFIGAEGTLGIVTAAVLKLFPKPRGREVAFVAVQSADLALQLLKVAQGLAGQAITSFELMSRMGLEFVYRHIPNHRDPLKQLFPWYILIEISSSRSAADARELMEMSLSTAMEDGIIEDAVLAENQQQQRDLWSLREHLPVAQTFEGGSIKHDIAVPVKSVPEFLQRAEDIVYDMIADARICAFGHLGDGNIHYNISQPESGNREAFMATRELLNGKIHELIVAMQGSVSAEHGIGLLKRELLEQTKSATEMAVMRAIKQALDPKGIMNPGKIV